MIAIVFSEGGKQTLFENTTYEDVEQMFDDDVAYGYTATMFDGTQMLQMSEYFWDVQQEWAKQTPELNV